MWHLRNRRFSRKVFEIFLEKLFRG